MTLPKITQYAHHLIRQYIIPGDVVVDATCGNGFDTLFLAEAVGPNGKVYAFDIQEEAVNIARSRLAAVGLSGRVAFIVDSHENLLQHIHTPIRAMMFNLGYLPGGNKAIATKAESTIQAIETGLRLLRSQGIISLCVYPGHPQGREESDRLLEWVQQLDQKEYQVLRYEYLNQKNNPPYLLAIYKY